MVAERRRGVSAAAAASAGGNDDVQGAMLEPSVANTPWVSRRRLHGQVCVTNIAQVVNVVLVSNEACGLSQFP